MPTKDQDVKIMQKDEENFEVVKVEADDFI